MDSGAVFDADRGNESSESDEDEQEVSRRSYTPLFLSMLKWARGEQEVIRRSYTPLSFYMDSTIDCPVPISYTTHTGDDPGPICMSNYIPLSLFPLGSTADDPGPICMSLFPLGSTAVSEIDKGNHTLPNAVSEIDKGNHTLPNAVSEIDKGNHTLPNEKKVSNSNYTTAVNSKVNHIPDDISFYILSKLPVKSLQRFECVQKSWSFLFENSHFMTMYTNHFISRHAYQNSDYHTFLLTNHFQVPQNPDSLNYAQLHLLENSLELNLPPLFRQHCQCMCSILCSTSVNGIFCFGQIYRSKNEVQYVLWNPVTENFRVIPPSHNELKPHYPQNNLYLEHAFHGFGYDKLRDDFKLIQLVSFISDDDGEPTSTADFFEIYSLNTNSWRMIDMGIPYSLWCYPQSFAGQEVYVDGACHWLCRRSYCAQRIGFTLLSFDLNHEAFITTPIGEESISPYTCDTQLAVLNGSIALISNYGDDIVFHISILGELGVSESWIKLYIYGPFPSIKWSPLGFGKTGYLFFTKKDYQLAYVDLSTQIVKELGFTCGNTGYFMLGLYKESPYSIGRSRI